MSKSSATLAVGVNSEVCSGVLVEEKSFTWKIEDFDAVRRSDKLIRGQSFQFQAGTDIGLPTTWTCYFELRKPGFIGVFFKLLKKPRNEEVNFAFTLHISRPTGGHFCNGKVKLKNIVDNMKGVGFAEVVQRNLPVDELPLVDGALIIESVFKLYSLKPCRLAVASIVHAFEVKSIAQLSADLENLTALVGSNADSVTKLVSKDNLEFPVNRGLLSARSSVFQRMFQSNMKEKKTGKVEINDLSGKTVTVLLHYIFTGRLHKNWNSFEVIEELPYAAHKYDLDLLSAFLNDVLGSVCRKGNASRLLLLARRLGMKKAEQELFTFVKNNAVSAEDLQLSREEDCDCD